MADKTAIPDLPPGEQAGAAAQTARYQRAHHPKIQGDEDYEALASGTTFVAPTGEIGRKPWYVHSDEDYDKVPEGEEFIDPEGARRQKPKYEGLDYLTQTLFDMASTPKEKKNALERGYKGKVKQSESGEFYIEDEGGVLRKPGHGAATVPGAVTAAAAPTAGSIAGGIFGAGIGGALGTAVPGPGNIAAGTAGALTGAGIGGAFGQGFNDIMLQLAGVYDRTPMEEVKELAVSGAIGMAGEGIGRGISAAVPVAKEIGSQIKQGAGKVANWAAKTDPEALRTARPMVEPLPGEPEEFAHGLLGLLGITKPRTNFPPSAVFKELPSPALGVEVRLPALHMQNPLRTAREEHYESNIGQLLKDMGVKHEGPIAEPTAAVSTMEAGQKILASIQQKSVEADAKVQARLQAVSTASQEEKATQVAALRQDAKEARTAAQALIDHGFTDIQTNVDAAMKATKSGHNSGDLWWTVGEKLKAFREGIQARARIMYDNAETLSGGIKPDTGDLPQIANRFLEELPGDFQTKHPDIVRKLRDMAGKPKLDEHGNPIAGEWEKEPVVPTWGQLHNMRSQFRSNVNWSDLSSDQWNGTYKFFATKVDNVLHDAKAVPELREASRALREADTFYAENMGPLKDRQIQGVMDGLRAGMPADPVALNKLILKDGRSDVARKIESIVGPTVWAGIRASDVQEMLDLSKTLVPGAIDGRKFASEVLKRDQHNMLELIHGDKGAGALREQAQRIEMLGGRLEITPKEGDTVRDIIAKAHQAAEVAEAAAKKNPIGALREEMKRMAVERKADPLHKLYEPSMLGSEAVEHILESEDRIIAASTAFLGSEKSPEFKLIQQIWLQKIFQGVSDPRARLAGVSKEVQDLMFPGVHKETLERIMKELSVLHGSEVESSGTASGMMARSTVTNPWGVLSGAGKLAGPMKVVPGANMAARMGLGKFYDTLLTLLNSPVTLRWLEKSLDSPNPEVQERARMVIREAMRRGGARGAGTAQAVHQQQKQEPELELAQ